MASCGILRRCIEIKFIFVYNLKLTTMQKLIEKNAEINNKRFIIIRSDNSKRVIQANDANVKSRAEHFAAYEKLTVISITEI